MKPLTAIIGAVAKQLPASLHGGLKRSLSRRRDKSRAAEFNRAYSVDSFDRPPCAVCGGIDVGFHFEFNGFPIVRCKHDGLIFVSPRPADVTKFYDDRYYTGQMNGLYTEYSAHANSMEKDWKERLARIESLATKKGRLLDVGAATGEFLLLARGEGWTVTGLEKSEWAAQRAAERGLDMVTGDLTTAGIPDESFDVITMWDCIEHLADPRTTLAAAARALVPGGVLAVSTGEVPHCDPRLNSGWYYPPWHLYYFSRETLSLLCDATGFAVAELDVKNSDTNYGLMTMFARRR